MSEFANLKAFDALKDNQVVLEDCHVFNLDIILVWDQDLLAHAESASDIDARSAC